MVLQVHALGCCKAVVSGAVVLPGCALRHHTDDLPLPETVWHKAAHGQLN
jgi:hypothetical protein